MGIPFIIEPVSGNGYRVTGAGGLSVGLSADGATADEAVSRLAEQVQSRLRGGARLEELSISAAVPAWKQDAGCLKDEPLFEQWLEAMAEYRRQLDADPEAL